MERLDRNLRVVITGASDGIGKEMAKAFARRGAKLGLVARRTELLEAVKKECENLGASKVDFAAADVTDSKAFRAALARLDDSLGGATHFVANAGVTGRSKIREDAFAEAKHCLDVNVIAAIDGLEWMKARMIQRGSGVLVGVSSVAATRGLPDSGAYSASKAALTTYLESMRVDLRGSGVQVLTIAPGFIDTELTRRNRGWMPFLMPAERAGEIFVLKVLRGRRFIVAPWPYAWLIRLLRWMPDGLYEAVLSAMMGGIRGSRAK